MAELGVVTKALLAIARDTSDDRVLATRICRACVEGLDVDGAAISLLTARTARQTLAATDETAELLEDLQFTLNEGACMEAARTGNPVLVADLRQSSSHVARWPMFAAAVLERSAVRAVFALPLQWGAVNLGVLDLYRRQPGALNSEQRQDALTTAETAALMMLGLRTEPEGHCGWLDPAVAHRAEIHQAAGMVSCNSTSAQRGRWRGCGPTRSCTTGCSSRSPTTSSPADSCSPRTWSNDETAGGVGIMSRADSGRLHSNGEELISRAFVTLADTLVDEYDVIELLNRLADFAVQLLPADAAGIVLGDARRELRAVAASDEAAHVMELLQLQADEGPCLDCFQTGAPVSVADLTEAAGRWPTFVAAVE